MWNIWKEELYKIASRKIIWLSVFLFLAFITFRLFTERDHYSVTIDGQIFRGQEAIRKDRELTSRYAGILTQDKVRQIYEEYGFYYLDETTDSARGNFCSRFVTETFTDYMQTDGNDPTVIHFYKGQDHANNTAPYLENKIHFDYFYGWNDFAEIYMTTLLAAFVILIVGLSPLFAEEYQLKTADILRTTRRGRQSGIWMKLLAALFFAAALICLMSAYLWGIYISVYGTQGLDASGVLLSFASFYGYCPETVAGLLALLAFLGLTGAILLTGLTAAVSASCRTPFFSLVLSLVIFLFPVVWLKVLGPMGIFGMSMTKNISHFMISMPVYLPMSTGFALSAGQIGIHLGIALTAGIGCLLLGYRKYRNA